MTSDNPDHPQITGDPKPDVTAHIRLLETSDVHANLLPYDYFAGTGDRPYGLARLATMIKSARSEEQNVFLFDNGDALQGTPLSDITAQDGSGWNDAHPVVTAMNSLKYDAATVGNHEFNFGLDWLTKALSHANYPVTCANIDTCAGNSFLPPYLLLDRDIICKDGKTRKIRLGVIGLVPPQITTWDHFHLSGRIETRDMVETATRLVPEVRKAGADLIVLLAHTGIDNGPEHPNMENAALPLAAIEGVDAILTGHSHKVFPQENASITQGCDRRSGTLNGTPAVMPGFRGSHLGVIDLDLALISGRWQVTHHLSQARAVDTACDGAPAPTDPHMTDVSQDAHHATIKLTSAPIGHLETPLHTYLAMVEPNAALCLVTQAQKVALSHVIQGTPHAALPILSASAPFKTGGRAGPTHFTEIPAGPLTIRNAADLYPFPNTLCGLRVTGAELKDWLERAAICFNQITPGQHNQPLCNPEAPGHNFDTIDGLSYQINLSAPPRYLPSGDLLNPDNSRIEALSFQGTPVKDSAEFLLATNSYRAFGGGPYRAIPDTAFVHISRTQIRDILAKYLTNARPRIATKDQAWRFASLPNTSVVLDTSPGIRDFPADLERIDAIDCGDTGTGFAQIRISL